MSHSVGFTGTRVGMTTAQHDAVAKILRDLNPVTIVHHGDCEGADDDFHNIVREVSPSTHIVVHPPKDDLHRAHTKGDTVELPQHYHIRNRAIVMNCSVLLVAPKTMYEEHYGGTWWTYRYARTKNRHIIVVWPDATTTEYKGKHGKR